MIRSELVKILVCPESQSRLEFASSDLVKRLNGSIAAGTLENRAGRRLSKALEGGLVPVDGPRVVYPIIDDIPMMLVDESISLDQTALDRG